MDASIESQESVNALRSITRGTPVHLLQPQERVDVLDYFISVYLSVSAGNPPGFTPLLQRLAEGEYRSSPWLADKKVMLLAQYGSARPRVNRWRYDQLLLADTGELLLAIQLDRSNMPSFHVIRPVKQRHLLHILADDSVFRVAINAMRKALESRQRYLRRQLDAVDSQVLAFTRIQP